MLVLLHDSARPDEVKRALEGRGLWVTALESGTRTSFVVAPFSCPASRESLLDIPGVSDVAVPRSPHPRLDVMPREVEVGDHAIGGDAPFAVIGGPCSVESEASIHAVAQRLAAMGVRFLRGGAFKPRTSPYAFQGMGEPALAWLRDAGREHGLAVVTEVTDPRAVEAVADIAAMIQVGSRTMQAFELLKEVGRAGKPVLLKRGVAATIDEWLSAAEYLLANGARGVVLCERGVRGFDASTRNLLDLAAVALLARSRKLPVIVDPSHGTGRRDLVLPLCDASAALGAAGVMVEVHERPADARSDGPQAITPSDLERAMGHMTRVAAQARSR